MIVTKRQKPTNKSTENDPWSPPGAPLRAKTRGSQVRPKGAQERPRRNQGRSKRAARESQDTPKEVQGSPKRAQETPRDLQDGQNHHQCSSKMAPTTSTWVPRALPELTYVKNVETSRNTIICVRIACAPRPWRAPCSVILEQQVGQKLFWRGGRAQESRVSDWE